MINRDLARSGTALLEDPAEDFFIAPVCTIAGEFHIAEGLWEKSANFTENMIEAFCRLPDDPVKHRALGHAYAALSISQILIERAYLRRFQTGAGKPKSNIPLPSQNTLNALSAHAFFSWSDLSSLPFDQSLIAPFIFDESQRASVKGAIPGDSALERQPLISDKKERDYDLSRFDRPQSIIGRPIVGISEGNDPLVVVAPGIIERSALHNIMGARGGGLHGEFWTSKEMRRFVGGMADTLGLEFNDQVAAAVAQLGLNARASVKPSDCLNQKATDELKRLGDIDVLAITDDGKHGWVIEAKDIRFCRTLGETASRLSEYRGLQKRDGKPDNLMRHLQRVDYVRKHTGDLAKRLKLAVEPKIHGLVIVDSPQPMAFLPAHPSVDARTLMLSDLSAVPWTKGWPRASSGMPKSGGKSKKRGK